MQKKQYISMAVIRRLPRYYHFLKDLDRRGILRVSSKELAEKMGFTASQVRQDFNCFGGYGQQGYGYAVHQLREEIGSILGVDRSHKCILLGAGNLGKAIATHITNNFAGFELSGIFDSSERIVGMQIAGKQVLPYSELQNFVQQQKPVMAILCVPRSAVEDVTDALYALGIRSYWNFSQFDIHMKYKDTVVENVHLTDSMMTLCYRVTELID
ncbi:MAG: redox-sensing transcriptional repressor Rex [Clostridia bacterium]|nr:redox-sensing transcriptional repressor Rex [Clostridia bacterium]